MSVGLIRNNGSGGGGTKGRFICNTNALQIDDVIRVKSLTNPTNVYEATVETIGETILFNVPGMDYYKVCLVQEIDDTPTEIGGIKTTLDIGESRYVNVIDKTSLSGIQAILNAHLENQELSVGDEISVVVGDENYIMQIAAIDLYETHEVILVGKDQWKTSRWTTDDANINYANSIARTTAQSFYTQLDEDERSLIKSMDREGIYYNSHVLYSDYVYIPNCTEVNGNQVGTQAPQRPRLQFTLFNNSYDRIKFNGNDVITWWISDVVPDTPDYASYVAENGGVASGADTNTRGIIPCFHLVADI